MAVYASGATWERLVKKFFEKNDFHVIRSAGSKGAVDLICFNEFECIVVQCKSSKASRKFKLETLFDEDIEKMKTLKAPVDWRRQVWLKKGKTFYIYHVDTSKTESIEVSVLRKVIADAN